MNAPNRAIACCLISVLVLSFIFCVAPARVEARDVRDGELISDEYVMVGGEPGEDPHLKHQTEIVFVNEPRSYGSSGSAADRGGDSYRFGSNRGGEREVLFVGSRVDWVRRTLLQTLLWMTHQ